VGNVDPSVSADQLYELCNRFGCTASLVSIVITPNPPEPGSAIVPCASEADAAALVAALNGYAFHGRILTASGDGPS
jgi:hypothetical protein